MLLLLDVVVSVCMTELDRVFLLSGGFMLLPLLASIALLAGIVTVWSGKPKRSRLTQPALRRRSFSLRSLLLFLFFPCAETLSASRLISKGRQRNNL